MMPRRDASSRPITGRMVLFGLIGFFGIVVAVNAVFIAVSLRSFPGVETEDAYRKGLAYDRVIEDAAAQRALGWTVTVDWQGVGAARGRFVVRALGADGLALSGLAGSATFRRPTYAGEDRVVALVPEAAGVYVGEAALPGPGNWEVVLRLGHRGQRDFVLRERIMVP